MSTSACEPAKAPRAVLLVAAVLAGFVATLGVSTPVPSEDGVSYLSMAAAFAAGRWHEGFGAVFPPGFPLLLAPFVAVGAPPWGAAITGGAVCLGLTLLPLWRLAEHHHAGAGWPAVVLFATAPLLPRVAAEVYSEPPFLLLMAFGTWWGCRGSWWRCGAAAGAAFWIRPEGLLLALAFVLVDRRAVRALLPAGLGVAALALSRGLAGHGFDALPMLTFHEQRDDLAGRGDVLRNLLAVPAAWFEAFGGLGAVVWLALRSAPRGERGGVGAVARAPLWWQIGLQVAVVCTFVVRRRFLLSCAVPVAALAGRGLATLPRRARTVLVATIAATGLAFTLRSGIDADRRVERELGQYLGSQLAPGERIASDLPRVVWFAGQPPPPPRHFAADRLLAFARAPGVRCVVLSTGSRRDSAREAAAALAAECEPFVLPPPLADACAVRGIRVLWRR